MPSDAEKLRRVEAELAYVREEYETFMSAISHDLSAPLRQIGGFSEIILKNNEDVLDEKTKRHFNFIAIGAEKGKSIIDALREFSHLHRNGRDFAEFNSQEVMEDVLVSLSAWIDQSEAEIDICDLPVMVGDKAQIFKVFFHLLKNSLLYRHEFLDTKISFSCREEGDFWSFTIIDNGIGIPENMDERIFLVLKRAVAPEDYPGHGIGLAIVEKIVHRHGGTVKLLRDMPSQTIFNFNIPKNPVEI